MKKAELFILVLFLIFLRINANSQTINSKKNIDIKYDEVIGCIDVIHGEIKIITTQDKFIITHTAYSTAYSKKGSKNFFKAYRGNKPQLIYNLLKKLKVNSKRHINESKKTKHYVIFTINNGITEEKYKYQVVKWNGLEIFFKKLEPYLYH